MALWFLAFLAVGSSAGSVLQGWSQVSLHQLVLFFKDGSRNLISAGSLLQGWSQVACISWFSSSRLVPGKLASTGSLLQGWS